MTNRFFHGTRAELTPGDVLSPLAGAAHVFLTLTLNLDEAIWSAELAEGDSTPKVYVADPLGSDERAAAQSTSSSRRAPSRTIPTSPTRSSAGIPPSRSDHATRCASRARSWTGKATRRKRSRR